MPATMIRDSAGHLRRLGDEKLADRMDDVRQKLEDFESLAEILLLNSELLRVQDARDLPFEPEHIMPMGEFVAKLCKMLTPAARRKGLAGVLYVDDTFRGVPKLWLDQRFMQIALYNLLQNGIKYSDDGTFIVVEAEPTRIDDKPWYQIHVRNSGIGVDEQDSDRVFERTFRTGRAMRKNTTGLGIGLAIARAMVERHGGRLVLTRLHDPTVFTIQLPGSLAEQKPT
jgi:signal transduction histidine kinase